MGCGTSKNAAGAVVTPVTATPEMAQTNKKDTADVAGKKDGGTVEDSAVKKEVGASEDAAKMDGRSGVDVGKTDDDASADKKGGADELKPLSKAASTTAIGAIVAAVVSAAATAIRSSRASLPTDDDKENLIQSSQTSLPSSPVAPAIVGLGPDGHELSNSNLVYQGGDEGNKYQPGPENPDERVEWVMLPPGELPEGVNPEDVKHRLEQKNEPEEESRSRHSTRPVLRERKGGNDGNEE